MAHVQPLVLQACYARMARARAMIGPLIYTTTSFKPLLLDIDLHVPKNHQGIPARTLTWNLLQHLCIVMFLLSVFQ